MHPKCCRCGADANLGFAIGKDAELQDYCHECFEMEHGDLVDQKEMAMKIAEEAIEKKKLQ